VSYLTSTNFGTQLKLSAATPPKWTSGSQITSSPQPAPEIATACARAVIAELRQMPNLAPVKAAKASSSRVTKPP